MIDPKRHEIFVDADTLIGGPSTSGGVEALHRLFGLDLFTGKVELNEPAMPNAGEDQLAQLQRPGLALDDGFVVIAYGQNTGDCPGPNGPAHGYVVSIPEAGGRLHYFQIGSGRDRGAVWMGGSSPVVDPHGNVYVASADGYDLGPGQPYDDSDAVLELSPTMHLESIFYPRDWPKLSADDLDLGTGDPEEPVLTRADSASPRFERAPARRLELGEGGSPITARGAPGPRRALTRFRLARHSALDELGN